MTILTMSTVTYPTSTKYPETEAQAYVARLANRPALAAVTGFLASFPVIKIFASNGVPLMLAREKARMRDAANAESSE
ncbi:hypothetical protein PACTADRAFT_3136 [Pachysolen tannophilus NRRL Y-2460]|uniref:Uncharacterized protein n=1 Tax=Pachysolen tannophilus NRRL Y-2460 TaxID=669874 RepID=A0A1E4TUI5_PACTA|nr:hypothetical protein PACTADRAFT_3136 [Pachysolen tannophilus NRRL Y-2460]